MDRYIANKLELIRDFKIKITSKERQQFFKLTTEIAVDRFARTLFFKYLDIEEVR